MSCAQGGEDAGHERKKAPSPNARDNKLLFLSFFLENCARVGWVLGWQVIRHWHWPVASYSLDLSEDVMKRVWQYSWIIDVAEHRVRFAGCSLAVHDDGAVIPLQGIEHEFLAAAVVDIFCRVLGPKHIV